MNYYNIKSEQIGLFAWIYILLENHELQLGIRSSQVSMRVFLNRFLI